MPIHAVARARRPSTPVVVVASLCVVGAATAFFATRTQDGDRAIPRVIETSVAPATAPSPAPTRTPQPLPTTLAFAVKSHRSRSIADVDDEPPPTIDAIPAVDGAATEGDPSHPTETVALRVVDEKGAPIPHIRTYTVPPKESAGELGGAPIDAFDFPPPAESSRKKTARDALRFEGPADSSGRVVVPKPWPGEALVVSVDGYIETAVAPRSFDGEIPVSLFRGARVDVDLAALVSSPDRRADSTYAICAYRRRVFPSTADDARFEKASVKIVPDATKRDLASFYVPADTVVEAEWCDRDGNFGGGRVTAPGVSKRVALTAPSPPLRTQLVVRCLRDNRRPMILARQDDAESSWRIGNREAECVFDLRRGPTTVALLRCVSNDENWIALRKFETSSGRFEVSFQRPDLRKIEVFIDDEGLPGEAREVRCFTYFDGWEVQEDLEEHLVMDGRIVAYVPKGSAATVLVRYAGADHDVVVPAGAASARIKIPPVGLLTTRFVKADVAAACELVVATSDGAPPLVVRGEGWKHVSTKLPQLRLVPGRYVAALKATKNFFPISNWGDDAFEKDNWMEDIVDRADVRIFGPVLFEVRAGETTTIRFGD